MASPTAAGDRAAAIFQENVKHYDSAGAFIENYYANPYMENVRSLTYDSSRNLYITIPSTLDKVLADGTGPTTIFTAGAHQLGFVRTNNTNLFVAKATASNLDARVHKLDMDGVLVGDIVTIPDEDGGLTTYQDRIDIGITPDGTKLYTAYGRLSDPGAVKYTTVWETVIATDTTTKVHESAAPDSPGARIGYFWSIVPLPDGTFALVHETGSTSPIIKRYDASWVEIENIAEETVSGILVNGVHETMSGGVIPLLVDEFMILSEDQDRLLFGVRSNSAATSEVWEYELSSKTITAKYPTGSTQNLRAFHATEPAAVAANFFPVVTVIGAN